MSRKCALVVDDSKSARFVLSKLLTEHGLDVDTAQSAEEALDYLSQKRPDAIFMDHLMPGMDGFQAVQAIKSNPKTATIPIMMYTSQQGELYVGQARALGAVGVLPKQTKQVEVSNVLKTLNLIPSRTVPTAPKREPITRPVTTSVDKKPVREGGQADKTEVYTKLRDLIAEVLSANAQEQRQQIKKDVLASYDVFAKRVISELRPYRQQERPIPGLPEEKSSSWGGMVAIGLFMLLALVFAGLYVDNKTRLRKMTDENTRLRSTLTEQVAENSAQSALLAQLENNKQAAVEEEVRQAMASIEWGVNQTGQYNYGEIPLGDERIETVRELLNRLDKLGFAGTVSIETHAGVFCLNGDEANGYVPASEMLPVEQCALRGNPSQDALTPGDHQSIAFANFLATSTLLNEGSIEVVVDSMGPQRPLVDYPMLAPGVTAGEWNRIARINNRVEITLQPTR